MSQKVLFLPGIMGSELYIKSIVPLIWSDQKAWIDPIGLLGGGLNALQLAPDGRSPGGLAGGRVLRPGPPLSQFYGPMISFLTYAGYDVLALGFDWRLSILDSGNAVWSAIQAWMGSQPISIVAHSMGGLVARYVYALMAGHGQGGQLQRLVCIATPHWGAWEAAFAWFHLARLYRWMQEMCGQWGRPLYLGAAALIDAIDASWPGLFELMPWRDYGPLHNTNPAQSAALYQVGTYGLGSNPFVTQARLSSAADTQSALFSFQPSNLMVGIYGVGTQTAVAGISGADPLRYSSYTYTDQGDGTVTVAEGQLAGVPQYVGPGSHELLCQMTWVQALVVGLLHGATPAAIRPAAGVSLVASPAAA